MNASTRQISSPTKKCQDFLSSTLELEMLASKLFKYSKTPTLSEDSMPEKLHHGQSDRLLGEEQDPDWLQYDRPDWRIITFRACELVVILVCVLMFAIGLRWQLHASQRCLELHSFYCKHSGKIDSRSYKVVLNEIRSTFVKAN